MHTFHLIIKKIIDIDNYQQNNGYIFDNIYKVTFSIFINKAYSMQDKFLFLNESLENIFHTDEIKKQISDYFQKFQKTYYAFSRLAHLYKYKKAKIMVNTDLIMNEIRENDKYVYCLFQNNCKYLFNIHELVKIIHNSIANSYHFFSSPVPIKNPYNNIIFDKSTLYNIYFFIQEKTKLHPELFYYFFKTNFNLNEFVKKYQYILRKFSIKNYLINSSKNTIVNNIECMIDHYNSDINYREYQIIIDKTFPKDLLIQIMKPYLELFLTSQYCLLYTDRIQSKKTLHKMLMAFNKFNPLFGRKTYKKSPNFIDVFSRNSNNSDNSAKIDYNTKHINFYEIENRKYKKEFLYNHASNLLEDYDPNDIENYDEDENDGDDVHEVSDNEDDQ
jgi:hypothetical protein